jgi:hypothetical protein
MLEELGNRWEIARNYFRLRACAIRYTPPSTRSRMREPNCDRLRPNRAHRQLATYRFASVIRNPEPKNYFRCEIFPFPMQPLALVVRGNAGYATSFTEAVVHDPIVPPSAAGCTSLRMDSSQLWLHSSKKPARVTLIPEDGRQASRQCGSPAAIIQRRYRGLRCAGSFVSWLDSCSLGKG